MSRGSSPPRSANSSCGPSPLPASSVAEKEHELGNSTFGRTVETAYHSRFQQFMTSLIPMHFYTSGTTLGYIYNHNSPAHRFFQHRQEPIVARCITASERFHHDSLQSRYVQDAFHHLGRNPRKKFQHRNIPVQEIMRLQRLSRNRW